MINIAVTGSIAYDYLMEFPGRFTEHILPDQLHQISLSFLVTKMTKMKGGTAPNIAYTLGLLGGNPLVMATAGSDFGEYDGWLKANGVDTSGIKVIQEDHCASFFANTDQDQNQIASFYAGAMAYAGELSFSDLERKPDIAIISPNDPGAMLQYVREAKRIGLKYIYDPSQQTIWLSGEDLKEGVEGSYMLTVNEYELGMIREKTGLTNDDIKSMVNSLLVTKGKEGAELTIDGQTHHIPIVPIRDAVDPTGAGDAFRAGLLRGIQLELPWEICGRLGALSSSYVLEALGPQGHHFSPVDFVRRYREHFDDQGKLDVMI